MADYTETTELLTGYGGRVHCGDTDGGSGIWDGAECTTWDLTINATVEDMSALKDLWKVKQWTELEADGNFEKMVAQAPVFITRMASNPVGYITLYGGKQKSSASDLGAEVARGVAIFQRTTFRNPKTKVLEAVSFTFSGAVEYPN